MADCTFDPKTCAGLPIGMFHCPECGEMVMAGTDHLPPMSDFELDEYDIKYLKEDAERLERYRSGEISAEDLERLREENPLIRA